jgi:molybdate transport system ATP-binding protein
MNGPVLTAKLEKRLRDFGLDVDLKLAQETLVLVGVSGCGKTTTLRLLAGLASPDRGRVQYDEQTWVDTDRHVRPLDPEHRRIGYVVQNYALFPHLSVARNIAYGLRSLTRAERRSRVCEVMDLLGISALSEAMPASLSGGEQQRVAMARALVVRPRLMLLDEPLSALDASIRPRVRGELRNTLRRFAIPAIVVTHDLEDALTLGDRIGVMEQGRIIQLGTADDLFAYPSTPFVASFVGTNLIRLPNGHSWVCFDPWDVSLTTTPGQGDYEWTGVVAEISQLGAAQRLKVSVSGGEEILADVDMRREDAVRCQPGQEVHLQVSAAAIRTPRSTIRKGSAARVS